VSYHHEIASRSVQASKLLSLVLRHRPQDYGLALDPSGWVSIDALLAALPGAMTAEELQEVVRTSDKQRFAISPDGTRIRAQQGHSVPVELGYDPAPPPEILFHGTVAKFLASIRKEGLARGKRHHVHLSETPETARDVGGRRGAPVIIRVRAAAMAASGYLFLRTPNGVWLTEHVPPGFLEIGE